MPPLQAPPHLVLTSSAGRAVGRTSTPLNRMLDRIKRARLAMAVSLAVAATVSCATPSVRVTFAEPKTYSEDTTLMLLADRSRQFDAIVGEIQAAELNEIRGLREARSTSFELVAGRSASDGTSPDPPDADDVSADLPAAPTGTVGLDYGTLLRRRFTQDQLRAAYELLYLGDSALLDPNRRAWLIRVDVSIDRFVRCGTTPKFIWVDFEVDAAATETTDGAGSDGERRDRDSEVQIYAVMPEYSAITSQESWSANTQGSAALRGAYPIGAVDLQSAASTRSNREETFLQAREHPLQFALYGESANRCTFAFGPRRRLTKRSWINPARWVGSTYRIDYEIHPGTMPCLFIVSTKGDVDELTVLRSIRGVEGQEVRLKAVAPVVSGVSLAERQRTEPDVVQELTTIKLSQEATNAPEPRVGATAASLEGAVDASASMLRIAPASGGTLLVQTESDHPVSSATRAILEFVPIPDANVRVRGKNTLEISVPPSPALEKWRLRDPQVTDPSARLRMHTPGVGMADLSVTLVPGEAPKKKSKWTVTPASGPGPLEVAVRPNDASLLSKVTRVEVTTATGLAAVSFFPDPGTKSLIVSIPAPAATNKKGKVSIRIHYGEESDYLASAFTYAN